ncbi:hypothetical protein CJ030_MR4G025282 [Morella rubra]|uniref:Protein BPS1, chloroplastic n=1 Tax=Morella rubra TaxID=262757 RepID=A0A6A1VR45_9ROSI|nr:hypothetical protein CJ030_MR4G025282 [Morella rubra]
MRAADSQGSFLNRISIRRNQVVSMDGNHEQDLEDLELFQKHVADRFSDLLSSSSEDAADALLSISWLRKLVDVFLCCEAEFKAILVMGRDPSQISKPSVDRLVPEYFDRVLKALDVCNAVSHGLESVRHYQKLTEIAITALEHRPIGDGQQPQAAERTWSFGRRSAVNRDRAAAGQFRSLSWNMAKGWSASKQIQAMSTNLVAPRGGESSGLASPVYVMSTVTVFVMWALVAAIPCQERNGLPTYFPVPRQLVWAQPMIALQEKIAEEWKKKKEKNRLAGLLEETQRLERLGQSLIEFADSFQFPGETERLEEVAAQVAELAETCKKMEEGLVPLQQQIRELFHKLVKSRTEVLELLDQSGKLSASTM